MTTTWKIKLTKTAAAAFLKAIGATNEGTALQTLAALPDLAVVLPPPSGPDTKANAESWIRRAVAEIAAATGDAMISASVVKQRNSVAVATAA